MGIFDDVQSEIRCYNTEILDQDFFKNSIIIFYIFSKPTREFQLWWISDLRFRILNEFKQAEYAL